MARRPGRKADTPQPGGISPRRSRMSGNAVGRLAASGSVKKPRSSRAEVPGRSMASIDRSRRPRRAREGRTRLVAGRSSGSRFHPAPIRAARPVTGQRPEQPSHLELDAENLPPRLPASTTRLGSGLCGGRRRSQRRVRGRFSRPSLFRPGSGRDTCNEKNHTPEPRVCQARSGNRIARTAERGTWNPAKWVTSPAPGAAAGKAGRRGAPGPPMD
jgi:hypothetical protein